MNRNKMIKKLDKYCDKTSCNICDFKNNRCADFSLLKKDELKILYNMIKPEKADLERFKKLFDKIGIRYNVYKFCENNRLSICIGDITWGSEININFDENDMFESFECWDE